VIARDAAPRRAELARLYPVVTVTGPRQSGKTTLCRHSFPDLPYVSLEPLDTREFALEDPRGFLATYPDGAVIDELQRFPSPPSNLLELLWTGAYPRIFDRQIPPQQWLSDYVGTYVQRDVQQLLRVGDLRTFTTLVRLTAGATATEVHLSRLGGDAGISHNTAKAWLSVLEASYLVFRIPAWHTNVRKQSVKSAKLHMIDSGLACYLLGIREPELLRTHPLRGAIFESWVAAELLEQSAHRGLPVSLHHYRDAARLEVVLLIDGPGGVTLVEVKSGATAASDFATGVERLATVMASGSRAPRIRTRVEFGGDARQRRGATEIVPWAAIDREEWFTSPGTHEPARAAARHRPARPIPRRPRRGFPEPARCENPPAFPASLSM